MYWGDTLRHLWVLYSSDRPSQVFRLGTERPLGLWRMLKQSRGNLLSWFCIADLFGMALEVVFFFVCVSVYWHFQSKKETGREGGIRSQNEKSETAQPTVETSTFHFQTVPVSMYFSAEQHSTQPCQQEHGWDLFAVKSPSHEQLLIQL